jgi:hypothetical protein
LNGCLVGPGMYQEWASYIYAARDSSEQNLELCRSQTNPQIFYYRVIKRIKQGEQLLAWYNESLEQDLARSLLNRDSILTPSHHHENEIDNTQICQRCMTNFEHKHLLKSHLLFDLCGKSSLLSTSRHKSVVDPIALHSSPTPPATSCSSSCSSSSTTSTASSNNSAFSTIIHHNKNKKIKMNKNNVDEGQNEEQKNVKKLKQEPSNSTNSPKSDHSNKNTTAYQNQQQATLIKNQLSSSGLDWKLTMLDGTHTVELNVSDEMGKQKKQHVCLFCGKIYNRKYGLKIHLRTHTGYKPLKCKVCSRPFSDPSNLNKHVRLHSQGETPYRCPYCGKILVRKRDLDRHIMSRHTQAASFSGHETNEDYLEDGGFNECEYDEECEEGEDLEEEEEQEIDVVDDFDEGENSDQGECPNGTTSSMTLFNSGLFIKTENNS